jgi:hypothetical protein
MNHTTGAQRYNARMDKIFEEGKKNNAHYDEIRKNQELDLLATASGDIINQLLNALEELAPEWYSRAQIVADADDFLKWLNGEGTDEEMRAISLNLTGKDFNIIL